MQVRVILRACLLKLLKINEYTIKGRIYIKRKVIPAIEIRLKSPERMRFL